jgi:hypothetical protein
MLEDVQNYPAKDDAEARDWMECNAFVVAVPLAYVAAVVIAVAVAVAVPDDAGQAPAGAAVHAASR